jgi:hypothetical protein
MPIKRTADPSTSVGMAKGGRCFRAKQMLIKRTAGPSTSVGMAKGRAALSSESDAD